MSKKTLLSESQVAKWMKLANIKGDVAQNFLNESKDSNKKVLNEMGMGYTPARDDDMPAESGMEEEGGMEEEMPEEEMGEEEESLEMTTDTKDEFVDLVADGVKKALEELGMVGEEMEEEPEMEGGELEGGEESAAPPAGEENLEEQLDVLTDDEIVNEVLKRVIRRLV